jgi:hypothetical protein
MIEMEIKNIGMGSTFRFFGGMFAIIGLILGLLAGLQGPDGYLGNFPALKEHLAKGQSACLLAGIIIGISSGIVIGIFSAFLAAVYNFFALLLGGIKLLVKE